MFGFRPIAVITLLLATVVLHAGQEPGVALHRRARKLMGTLFEVRIYHSDPRRAAAAAEAALDEMQRVDELLSTHRPDSELSLVNREASARAVRVSEPLFDFLQLCEKYVVETGGTFDPAVGPLVRAWGFLGGGNGPARPPEGEIESAAARSGFDKVRLDDVRRTVYYSIAGVEIDPGGIGKGHAVDRGVAVLRRLEVDSALVSAGGSTIYALGAPPGRSGWKVAVASPLSLEPAIRHVVLRDKAVSTSGVAYKFAAGGGRRYSHIFDPRSGRPVEGMCQVSVMAPSATGSDALSKAAFILSREALTDMLDSRRDVHVLRLEGPCGPRGTAWSTPWSATVFAQDAGSP